MPLTFTCPHCATDFPVAEEERGFSVYCDSCGRECLVPDDLGIPAAAVAERPAWMKPADVRSDRLQPVSDRREAADLPPTVDFHPPDTPRAPADPLQRVAALKLRDESVVTSVSGEVEAEAEVSGRRSAVGGENQSGDVHHSPLTTHQPAKPRRASIFTAEGASRVLEKTAGEVECFHCHTRIPYTIEQQGTTVYCPSCGDGVPLGEQLQKIAVARAATLRTDESKEVNVAVSKPRFYWVRSPAALATLAAGFVVLLGGGYALWKDPSLLPEGIREVIQTSEASSPSSTSKPDDKIADEEPENGKITLEAIRKLLDRKDTRMALIQAQYWDQDLKRQKLPAAELRRRELAKVIAILFDRLTPGPKSTPKYVLRFRKLIDDLGKALADGKVSQARKLYDEANAIFRKHPKQLADESSWLVNYGAWLARLELKASGLRTVETSLKLAADLARDGKPTAALEYQARAKWLTRKITITDEQFNRLETLNRKTVEPLVNWARGKRALFDAEDCQRNGDKAARDQQLEIATSTLPEIPQSLPGVADTGATKLNVDARKLRERTIFSPVSTVLGKELDVRYRYEQALPHLAQGKTGEFAAAAADVKRRFEAVTGRDRLHEPLKKILSRLPDLAFDMITQGIAELDDEPEDARPRRIVELRGALNRLSVWKERPKWSSLDASLRKLSKDLVAARLKDAKAAAKTGDLDRAVRLAGDAEAMAGGQTAKEAHALRTKWEQERKLATSAAARQQHLKRIDTLVDTDKPLAAAREIASFERRYGKAAAPLELAGYRTRIERKLNTGIAAVFTKSEALQQKGQWGDLRKELAQLDGVPLSVTQQSRYDALQKELKSLKGRADGLMIQARRLNRLATPDEMIRAIKLTQQILELDPGNDEAVKLNSRAKSIAGTTAASLLRRAEAYRNSRSSYLRGQARRYLQDVVKLDPAGPHGKRAKQLLGRR